VDVYGYDLQLADDLLKGTLADGTAVELPVWQDPGATITLHNIPEPCTLVGVMSMAAVLLGADTRRR